MQIYEYHTTQTKKLEREEAPFRLFSVTYCNDGEGWRVASDREG